ncbi:MAG: exo-alpha-sialidase [Saprospiraceae bacterium]
MLFWLVACKTEPTSQEEKMHFRVENTPITTQGAFPSLHTTADGQLLLSWLHEADTTAQLMVASWQNAQWSQPVKVAQGNNWFVNWADFPSFSTRADGTWLTYYLPEYDPENYGYNISMIQSNNKGQSWSEPIHLYRDQPNTTQGFVSFFPMDEHKTGVTWLEVDQASGGSAHHHHDEDAHNMILRFASVDASGKVTEETLLDDRVCTCCQTDAVAIPGGAVVVYRDRSAEEIRDIYYVRLQNGVWSKPQPLHEDGWNIKGCPVNGPAIDANGSTVAAVWYTMPKEEAQVWLRFSEDGGSTFKNPIRIDQGNPLGRLDVLMLDANRALVSWLEKTEDNGALRVKVVHKDGTILADQEVSMVEPARPTGFPRLAKVADKIYITWTEGAQEKAVVKLVSADIADLN